MDSKHENEQNDSNQREENVQENFRVDREVLRQIFQQQYGGESLSQNTKTTNKITSPSFTSPVSSSPLLTPFTLNNNKNFQNVNNNNNNNNNNKEVNEICGGDSEEIAKIEEEIFQEEEEEDVEENDIDFLSPSSPLSTNHLNLVDINNENENENMNEKAVSSGNLYLNNNNINNYYTNNNNNNSNNNINNYTNNKISNKKKKRVREEEKMENITRHQRGNASSLSIIQAASFVDDALKGRFEMHKIDRKSLTLYRIYHKPIIRYLLLIFIFSQIFLLPMIEYPAVFPEISLFYAPLIEIFILLFYFALLIFKYSFLVTFSDQRSVIDDLDLPSPLFTHHHNNNDNNNLVQNNNNKNNKNNNNNNNNNTKINNQMEENENENENKWNRRSYITEQKTNKAMTIAFTFLILSLLFDALFYLFSLSNHFDRPIRYLRLLRPLIAIYYIKPLQFGSFTIILMMPTILEITFLILVLVFLYALISYLIFIGTSQGDLFFSSLLHSFLSYYILMTTANYPDVMMPTYSESAWSCLIFISFIILTTYLLKNLILAYIFRNYSQLMKMQFDRIALFERQRLYLAFSSLDPFHTGKISFKVWDRFIRTLKIKYSKGKSALIFRILNHSKSGEITINEFVFLLDVLRMKIYQKKKVNNFFYRLFPSLYPSRPYRLIHSIVTSPIFEWGMYIIVLVNVIRILHQFLLYRSCELVNRYELVFDLIFLAEFVLKLYAIGPKTYFFSGFHFLDFMIIVVSMLEIFYFLFIDPLHYLERKCDEIFFRSLFLFPTLRLTRILTLSSLFLDIAQTIKLILPFIPVFILLQFLTLYVWTIVGMELWAGEIYRGNPLLVGTDFANLEYFSNNFNNLLRAYVTIFELLMINNWHVITSGYVAISGNWAWLFFITFNLWVVIVAMNWLMATIIQTFHVFYAATFSTNQSLDPSNPKHLFLSSIRSLNSRFTEERDYFWKVKEKKKFRDLMQKLYNAKDTEDFIVSRLGDHSFALQKSRDVLKKLHYSIFDPRHFDDLHDDAEAQPLLH